MAWCWFEESTPGSNAWMPFDEADVVLIERALAGGCSTATLLGGLRAVDLKKSTIIPVYWPGDPVAVLRAKWYLGSSPSTLQPYQAPEQIRIERWMAGGGQNSLQLGDLTHHLIRNPPGLPPGVYQVPDKDKGSIKGAIPLVEGYPFPSSYSSSSSSSASTSTSTSSSTSTTTTTAPKRPSTIVGSGVVSSPSLGNPIPIPGPPPANATISSTPAIAARLPNQHLCLVVHGIGEEQWSKDLKNNFNVKVMRMRTTSDETIVRGLTPALVANLLNTTQTAIATINNANAVLTSPVNPAHLVVPPEILINSIQTQEEAKFVAGGGGARGGGGSVQNTKTTSKKDTQIAPAVPGGVVVGGGGGEGGGGGGAPVLGGTPPGQVVPGGVRGGGGAGGVGGVGAGGVGAPASGQVVPGVAAPVGGVGGRVGGGGVPALGGTAPGQVVPGVAVPVAVPTGGGRGGRGGGGGGGSVVAVPVGAAGGAGRVGGGVGGGREEVGGTEGVVGSGIEVGGAEGVVGSGIEVGGGGGGGGGGGIEVGGGGGGIEVGGGGGGGGEGDEDEGGVTGAIQGAVAGAMAGGLVGGVVAGIAGGVAGGKVGKKKDSSSGSGSGSNKKRGKKTTSSSSSRSSSNLISNNISTTSPPLPLTPASLPPLPASSPPSSSSTSSSSSSSSSSPARTRKSSHAKAAAKVKLPTLSTSSSSPSKNSSPIVTNLVTTTTTTSTTEGVIDGAPCRVEYLPITWHKVVHDDEFRARIESISLNNNKQLRGLANSVFVDVMFYLTGDHQALILTEVINRLNEVWERFTRQNPLMDPGEVSIVAHSLGSVIAFDMLTQHLQPSQGRGMNLPKLKFTPKNFFALGSPIAMFLAVRGATAVRFSDASAQLYGGCRIFNIFHPLDLVAYRIEPLIHPVFSKVAPEILQRKVGGKAALSWKQWWSGKADTEKKEAAGKQTEEAFLLQTLGIFNKARIDYSLQETTFESLAPNAITGVQVHGCYWDSEETVNFILEKILPRPGAVEQAAAQLKKLSLATKVQVSTNPFDDLAMT